MVSHYHVFLHHAFVPLLLLLILAISSSTTTTHAASTENGEEARWLVQASKWATVAWIEGGDLKSLVMSIAESNGRIFLYLSEDITFKASLTLSEAQVDPSQFFGAKCGPDGALDPQDPVSLIIRSAMFYSRYTIASLSYFKVRYVQYYA